MPLVLDTDVLSFLYKRDTRAQLYEPHLNDPPFVVSFMSLANSAGGRLNAIGATNAGTSWKCT